jgi:anti-sigma B factor antagonist
MELSLTTRHVDGVVVFDVSGRLCAGGAITLLRDAIKESVESGTTRVVINLADVTFIDSSGLGELITTHTSLNNRGGTVNLLKPSTRIKELLRMTRLTAVLTAFDDEALAVQALKA